MPTPPSPSNIAATAPAPVDGSEALPGVPSELAASDDPVGHVEISPDGKVRLHPGSGETAIGGVEIDSGGMVRLLPKDEV
jgi:hypothetical protein